MNASRKKAPYLLEKTRGVVVSSGECRHIDRRNGGGRRGLHTTIHKPKIQLRESERDRRRKQGEKRESSRQAGKGAPPAELLCRRRRRRPRHQPKTKTKNQHMGRSEKEAKQNWTRQHRPIELFVACFLLRVPFGVGPTSLRERERRLPTWHGPAYVCALGAFPAPSIHHVYACLCAVHPVSILCVYLFVFFSIGCVCRQASIDPSISPPVLVCRTRLWAARIDRSSEPMSEIISCCPVLPRLGGAVRVCVWLSMGSCGATEGNGPTASQPPWGLILLG